jgi:putative phosphoribosyl transferase
VGADDTVVLELNCDAQNHLVYANDLVVIPSATHLFEEPGTLDLAAQAALDWFAHHVGA